MPDNDLLQSSNILCQTEDGRTRIHCPFENETVWLTQALIAELFQVAAPKRDSASEGDRRGRGTRRAGNL